VRVSVAGLGWLGVAWGNVRENVIEATGMVWMCLPVVAE
jgi:hypothetical protein